MKLEKFMCEVTKALVKDKMVMFCEYGDKLVISPDGYFAMIYCLSPSKATMLSHS